MFVLFNVVFVGVCNSYDGQYNKTSHHISSRIRSGSFNTTFFRERELQEDLFTCLVAFLSDTPIIGQYGTLFGYLYNSFRFTFPTLSIICQKAVCERLNCRPLLALNKIMFYLSVREFTLCLSPVSRT